MQRKRVHVNSTLVAGVGNATSLIGTIDESNGVNAHNLNFCFTCEPDSTDANSAGQWVLWCLPDETSGIPNPSIAGLEAEGSNAFLWASGLWNASNQTPYTSPNIHIATSRNCQNGARLVLIVRVEGITAGSTRVVQMLTYNTKSL